MQNNFYFIVSILVQVFQAQDQSPSLPGRPEKKEYQNERAGQRIKLLRTGRGIILGCITVLELTYHDCPFSVFSFLPDKRMIRIKYFVGNFIHFARQAV